MSSSLNPATLEPLKTAALPVHWRDGVDRAAIDRAIGRALDTVDRNLAHFGDAFPRPSSTHGVYAAMDNTEWTNGFWTGMLWLAYELTGAARYRDAALRHVHSFHARQRDRINVNHHDLGFLYSLSCVAGWQLTGEPLAAEAALGAARLLLQRYLPGAGIIQAWGELSDPAQRGRMIIDCNLNLPLLYWAADHTGDPAFRVAAARPLAAAPRPLGRAGGAPVHTVCLGPATGAPLHGKTHQGHADDSCWARGQAWGISGFPLVYRHNGDSRLIQLAQVLANYYLNRLPEDGICYWDLDFTSGPEPRDSSGAAIAACGLLELAQHLPLADPLRAAYERAAAGTVHTLAQDYADMGTTPGAGLLQHGVYHKPNGVGVDEACIWGDYFYLEALVRLTRTWRPYW